MVNVYFPLAHNPDGLRTWWRRLYDGSDELLDDTHLMRMAGQFARRVKACAAGNGVPVIFCTVGQRKHVIAEECPAGVFRKKTPGRSCQRAKARRA